MAVAKCIPGSINASYVAGMDVTALPTQVFSVSNALGSAHTMSSIEDENNQSLPLGTKDYTLIMWCPSTTARHGIDSQKGSINYISPSSRLGGMVVLQSDQTHLAYPVLDQLSFERSDMARTMTEVYGSDMEGYTSGGFIWSAQADVNVLAPAANMVGSWYSGTITFGQLPSGQYDRTEHAGISIK